MLRHSIRTVSTVFKVWYMTNQRLRAQGFFRAAVLFSCLLLPYIASADPFAYVAGEYGTVACIDVATNTVTAVIPTTGYEQTIAITPDGKMAYVCCRQENTVIPINLATNIPGTAIEVGTHPSAIAITPDGIRAYVCNADDNTVTPITLATNTPGTAIEVGTRPLAIAITPDGTRAYVCNANDNTVTPITLATNTTGIAIGVGAGPVAIAITPDGTRAYVCTEADNTVTPITLATNTTGIAIEVGGLPNAIAITPDGRMAYVCGYTLPSYTVTPITLATNTPGTAIELESSIENIAITPDGTTAYVCRNPNIVVPIPLATGIPGTPISIIGSENSTIAITPDQAPTALFTTSISRGSASFDASASSSPVGSIATYAWDFGDGTTESTASPTTGHTYSSTGTYTVTLTVTNTSGTSTRQTFTGKTVSNNGGPSATSSAPVTIPPFMTFTGKIKKNNHKEKICLKTRWQAARSSSKIRCYQIFSGRKKIKTISDRHIKKTTITLHPHLFPFSISDEYRTYLHNKYKIRVVYRGGTVSAFTKLALG
jgi:YVTN family beta-propeller protein